MAAWQSNGSKRGNTVQRGSFCRLLRQDKSQETHRNHAPSSGFTGIIPAHLGVLPVCPNMTWLAWWGQIAMWSVCCLQSCTPRCNTVTLVQTSAKHTCSIQQHDPGSSQALWLVVVGELHNRYLIEFSFSLVQYIRFLSKEERSMPVMGDYIRQTPPHTSANMLQKRAHCHLPVHLSAAMNEEVSKDRVRVHVHSTWIRPAN